MKKIALYALLFTLTTSFVLADSRGSAATPETTLTPSDSFYLGFASGADLPGTHWGSNYTLGGGAQAFGGYHLDQNWAIQLDIENWFFEGMTYSLYNLRALAFLKYTFNVKGWQPYLLVGGGVVDQSLSTTGTLTPNLDTLGGVGVQWDLTHSTHLFMEAKYNFILPSTGSFQDVPISMGLWVSLP